jgi:peptidoglycan/LPS O-acetylase OafA/YrhL
VEAVALTVEARLRGRANNFDVLRLLAATLVFVSHCYPLTGYAEPFGALAGWTLGEVGVVMFFAMSGFLIAKSWTDRPQLVPFALKRGLRLLPALVVAVALTVFAVGPLFTTLSVGGYFADPATWLYLARNSLLLTFSAHLPGVFAHNVYPDAINGSLWTLPVEVSAYAFVAGLGLVGLLRRSWILVVAASVAVLLTTPLLSLTSTAGDSAAAGDTRIIVKLFAAFLLGSLMFTVRRRLPLSWVVFTALAALWVVTWDTAWTTVTGVLAISYGVLVLGLRTPDALRKLAAPGDVSYGIYIYAFPVQQSVAALVGPSLTPAGMLALAYPPTYVLALASWRMIEQPALSLKGRLGGAPKPRQVSELLLGAAERLASAGDTPGAVPVNPPTTRPPQGNLPGRLRGNRDSGGDDRELLSREKH